MDEIRLYNRALTATEVSTLYGSSGTAMWMKQFTPAVMNQSPFSETLVQASGESEKKRALIASL
jgi:hypothetical protein